MVFWVASGATFELTVSIFSKEFNPTIMYLEWGIECLFLLY